MDYRKFLGKEEVLVLPYFGGTTVDAPSRRLRLPQGATLEPGWRRFRVAGRVATPGEATEPEGLDGLPAVRGHLVGVRLVQGGASAEQVFFTPEEEPPLLAPCRARRWHSGELCFQALDFEGEAEESARRSLEEGRSLQGVKGISASLRAAFGMAVLEAASRELGIPVSGREGEAHTLAIAERGRDAAVELLGRLDAERREHERALAERRRRADMRLAAAQAEDERARRAEALRRVGPRAGHLAAQRAEEALDAAGARLLASRTLGEGRMEVTFSFMNERFISVADMATLQVLDAGICLSGSDREVTLESLPSVIREAIETRRLNITRR